MKSEKQRKNYFAIPGYVRTVGFDDSEYQMNKISSKVCEIMGVQKELIFEKVRTGKILSARQISMFCISRRSELSLHTIGKFFSLDHATVLNAKKKIQMFIDVGDEEGLLAESILKQL